MKHLRTITAKSRIRKLYRILFGSKTKQTTFKKWYKKNT